MKKRLILLAGLGIGFVLGSYSGRSSYEKLRAQVDQLWSDPRVKEQLERAGDTLRDKAPEVAAGVQQAASAAVATGREKAEDLREFAEKKAEEFTGESPDDAEGTADPADTESDLDPEHIPPLGEGEITVEPDFSSDPETPMEDEGPMHER